VSDHEAAGDGTTEHEGISRRGFIAGAAGLTGVALSGTWRGTAARAAVGRSGRVFTSGPFAFLQIDGVAVGAVRSFDGGNRFGEVVTEDPDPDGVIRKHIGDVGFEDVTITCGLGMGTPMEDWITEFANGGGTSRDIEVIVTDQTLHKKSRTTLANCYMHEVGFPTLDAASTAAPHLTVKILSFGPVVKHTATGTMQPPPQQPQWRPANFHLNIGSVDTSRVDRIEAFALRQQLFDNAPTRAKFTLPRPVVEDLRVRLTEATSSTWFAYLEAFLDGEVGELSGNLDVLSANLATTLLSVGFVNLGLHRVDPDPVVASTQTVRKVKAEMYCEELSFTFPP
jgi:hypothetical protein